jgi:hypothetical protein
MSTYRLRIGYHEVVACCLFEDFVNEDMFE